MSRALRRHPASKQAKGSRGRAGARPLSRSGTRAAPRGESRSTLGGVASWRPRFIMDIISELRKVVWPSRQDAVHLTIVVLFVSALVGAALGGIDIGFGWLIDNTILR
jgi:preprotein translocase subunit SecE